VSDSYLHRLDSKVRSGLADLGAGFADRHAGFLASKQMPDGGFSGRRPGSDPYYTDFALRALAALKPECERFTGAAGYLRNINEPPRGVTDSFSRLSCARTLSTFGLHIEVDTDAIHAALEKAGPTPYDTFLSALCRQMLGEEPFQGERPYELLRPFECPDGGFAQAVGETAGQTNATAAAVGALVIGGDLSEAAAQGASRFLLAMQAPGGGIMYRAGAPEPDLLSTFTALVTLTDLGTADRADLAGLGRFLRAMSKKKGGFRASASDPQADVEYTYYGAATAALLRSHLTGAAN
jgi:geranylgeranyl transferase type-2 subunit beta